MKRKTGYIEDCYVNEYTPFWQVCLLRHKELGEKLPKGLKHLIAKPKIKMNKREFTRANTITQKKYGCKVKFIPLVHKCTYHDTNNRKRKCRNCNNTNYYVDGYHMILNNKIGWTVDNIK